MADPRPTILSLFSGIGGLEMGLARALGGARLLGCCERDAFAASVLLARMEEETMESAPVWCGSLEDADFGAFEGRVDWIAAGFPCQPWSAAGKRKGTEDDRWLWPALERVLRAVRPRGVFLENVPQLARGGLGYVLRDLSLLGFDAEWATVSAAEVGAPHLRKRLFVLAHRTGARRACAEDSGADFADAGTGIRSHEPDRQGDDVVNADGEGLQGRGLDAGSVGDERRQLPAWPPGPDDAEGWARVLETRPDLAPALPPVRGVADGVHGGLDAAMTNRTDRLRSLGNAVVPAQAEYAFRLLARRIT